MKLKKRCERLQEILPADVVPVQEEIVLVKENVEVDGRILQRSVEKTVDPSERMSKFKAQDFATENLIAIGAVDHFKPIGSIRTGDIDVALEAMENLCNMELTPTNKAKLTPAQFELSKDSE